MDDLEFLDELDDFDDEFILSDDLPLDDEFIRTHFNTCDDSVIENFPFIEDDVDAITDYELFSRGFGYLDKKKADKEDLVEYAKKDEIPDVSEFVKKDTNDLENYPLSSSLSDVAFSGDYDDLLDKPTIPTKTSDLNNDSGFITKSVNDLTNYTKTSDLSTVATTGDYDDLIDKPTIPTKTSDLNNDSGFITKSVNDLTNYTLTSNLSSVATSGSYNDLSNKPTIPTVPTNISAFNNDSGYITNSVNNLTNYTKTSDLNTYSSSETVCGKWIDNKPIYRRVFTLTPQTTPALVFNNNIDLGLSNIGTFTRIDGVLKTGDNYNPVPAIYIENDDLVGRFNMGLYRIAGSLLYISAGSYHIENINSYTFYLIVEYTKSTD